MQEGVPPLHDGHPWPRLWEQVKTTIPLCEIAEEGLLLCRPIAWQTGKPPEQCSHADNIAEWLICICAYQLGHHDTSRTQPQPLSRHESHHHPHEWSGKDATSHQSSQSHWLGRNACTPIERSCRSASSNANNNLSGIIQPRHRLLQTDGTHYAVQHNASPW